MIAFYLLGIILNLLKTKYSSGQGDFHSFEKIPDRR